MIRRGSNTFQTAGPQMAVRLSVLIAGRRPLPPGKPLVLTSARGRVRPRAKSKMRVLQLMLYSAVTCYHLQ
jgi:hypothetical protein